MTDISALEAYAGQLSGAAAKAETAAETQRQIVNGDAFTDVLTESGLVPTLAKQAVLAEVKVTASLAEVASQMAGSMTYASTAAGLAGTVDGGYFSTPSPESSEYLILYQNVAGAAVEKKRYPGTVAIDDLRNMIAPSSSVPEIFMSVADADGFEMLQAKTDGSLKSLAFEIGANGLQTEQLSVLSLELPGSTSAVSLMDADGFHFSLDPVAQAVAPAPLSTSVLASLRRSLANELEDVMVRLVGDSITWGMTVTGGGVQDPRTHALTDPRNNLTSPSWANLLHKYLGSRYSAGVMSNPAPGVALYEATHNVDITLAEKVTLLNTATRATVTKPVAADANALLEVLCTVPDGHALCFDTVGTGFSLVYRESAGAGTFVVLIDGVVNRTVVTANAVTTYGKLATITLPAGKHAVEVRCTGAVAFEAIQRNRKIRVANDGLIGTNTAEWLPGAGRLSASIANDDTHVFVQLGTNDRALTTEPNDPARTKRNLLAIADYAINARGKSLILMAANYADTDYPTAPASKYSQADVARVIAQVATSLGCGYIDNYSATLKLKLAGTSFLADGLHPNDAGHLQKLNNIVDCLEQA